MRVDRNGSIGNGTLGHLVLVQAQQAAYIETAIEDGDICTRMDRGRRALYVQGLNEVGPYQSPMEDAEVHFHEWLRSKLGIPAAP